MTAPRPPKICAGCHKVIAYGEKEKMDTGCKGEPQPYHEKCLLEKRKEERLVVEWMKSREIGEWNLKKEVEWIKSKEHGNKDGRQE